MSKLKIVAVLPAYQAARTLKSFLKSFPKQIFDRVILVDDWSQDGTYKLAQKYSWLKVYQTPRNLGYGGNIKLCFQKALQAGADVVVEIHPDGEYLPDAIVPSLERVRRGAKLVLGNRFAASKPPLKSGMRWWKYPLIKTLNSINNLGLGTAIPDLHQGFRVYSQDLLKSIDFQQDSNGYLFFFELLTQSIYHQVSITSVPVSTYYRGKKRGASFKNCLIYSLGTFKVTLLYWLAKSGLYQSRIFATVK